MSWASHAITELKEGRQTVIHPRGHSMKGKVESGQRVLLAPCEPTELKTGDIVLVRCSGRVYLHLVKAIGARGWLIGNNRGRDNGWVGASAIYGKAIEIG